jgi:protein-tyrosine phosphatase
MPFGDYDPSGTVFSEYSKFNIKSIVLLASDDECIRNTGINLRKLYINSGMSIIYLPIPDYGVPDKGELQYAVERAVNIVQKGSNLAIHCSAGIGRTGTFAACLAKHLHGGTGMQAIEWIRKFIPGAIENDEQEQLVIAYEIKEAA